MKKESLTKASERAKEQYDSAEADKLYREVWGGEDIHVGLYDYKEDSIAEASQKTVVRMADKVEAFLPGTQALELGSGYGGAARFLARQNGYRVICLNVSERQNERNRAMTQEQGLSVLVEVVEGSYEELPFPDESFDLVWSQDALLHGGDRERVFREVDRVLRPGGEFILADRMRSEEASEEDLKPILESSQLESLSDPETYKRYAEALSWKTLEVDLKPDHMAIHYERLLEALRNQEAELTEQCGNESVSAMKQELEQWERGARDGRLTWGMLRFAKPSG